MHVWNLPLHGWSWGIISEVLRPACELVALFQATTEIEVSLGMRKYVLIVTGDQGVVSVFKRELG